MASLVVLAGCGKKEPPPPAAVPVKVMTVLQQDTPLFEEFVGEVTGSREVSLRAQITGVLMSKHFDDGSLVTEGQKLFSIDPRAPLAEQANARAGLAAARADLARARQDVDRYGPLVKENAISKQIYDNAVAAMTSLLEPIMIIFLAIIVGSIVIALFLPLIDVALNADGPQLDTE
jgi:membrane fusion protein (multidrug efflux system)